MTSDRVLIRATSQRSGGGIQVAASFLEEIAALGEMAGRYPWLEKTDYWVSSQVFDSLSDQAVSQLNPRVADHRPWQRVRSDRNYRVSFAVFGPEYLPHRRADTHIAGYADVRSVLPFPKGESITWRQALRWKVRGMASRAAIRRADCIVVESKSMCQVLRQRWRIKSQIEIVPNVYHAIFDSPDDWEAVALPPREEGEIWLSYVSRPYPHKNLEFLAKVRAAAHTRGANIKFLVTLTQEEWAERTVEFRDACINVGPLRVAQVPTLLVAADGGFFPSLLESFSVSPLEVLCVGKPLFASDRSFVRDACLDAPRYFDPLDADVAADQVVATFGSADEVARMVKRGYEVLHGMPSAGDRAEAYLALIDHAMRGVSASSARPR